MISIDQQIENVKFKIEEQKAELERLNEIKLKNLANEEFFNNSIEIRRIKAYQELPVKQVIHCIKELSDFDMLFTMFIIEEYFPELHKKLWTEEYVGYYIKKINHSNSLAFQWFVSGNDVSCKKWIDECLRGNKNLNK